MPTNSINYYDQVLNIRDAIDQAKLQDSDDALYICDLSSLERRLRLWQKHLPSIKPYYAVKCNDDRLIVKTLAELGVGFDCASKNEVKLVLELHVEPERIIFANPCRFITHLDYAREHKVRKGTVDNEFEMYKLYKHYPESDLIIRIKSEAKDAQFPLGAKFGCDADKDAAALLMLAKALDLSVIGTSFHVGSGCNELEAFGRAIEKTRQIYDFGKVLGYNLSLLDIGGGFPGTDDNKFEKVAKIVNTSVSEHFADENIKIIAEPGCFFATQAYTLICKVHAKREVRNAAGILDTIMYYLNIGVYGSFIDVLFDHPVVVEHYLENADSLPLFKSLIWGPTCDATDKIADDVFLPNLSRGDYVGFPNMGAYTSVFASNFNGFPLPKTTYFKAKLPIDH